MGIPGFESDRTIISICSQIDIRSFLPRNQPSLRRPTIVQPTAEVTVYTGLDLEGRSLRS